MSDLIDKPRGFDLEVGGLVRLKDKPKGYHFQAQMSLKMGLMRSTAMI